MNFMQRYLNNAVPVWQNFGALYNQKQSEGKSFHQADYIQLGIGSFVALIATIMQPAPPAPPAGQ